MEDLKPDILSVLWFFGVFIWSLLFTVLSIPILILVDIIPMIKLGVAMSTAGFMLCYMFSFFLIITLCVPSFRWCFYKFPWLYPFSIITLMDLMIFSISEMIIYEGYQVISTPRHIATIVIMIIQIIVCRLIMCQYLKKKPFIHDDEN